MHVRIFAPLFLLAVPLASAFADDASERAAGQLLEAKLGDADRLILNSVRGKDIVVVRGSMDSIEEVLARAKLPFTIVDPEQVAGLDLDARKIVMVNCPGVMPDAGVLRIERFVRAGGLLYTTDWSLKNLIEKAFPGTITHNGFSTGSEVVPVTITAQNDDLMSQMLLSSQHDPQWWLEGGSYPIKIRDPKRVKVLATSAEMGARYKASAVVVRFRWDDGEVIHVVSHFYRQMDAAGPAVAAKDAVDDIEGLTAAQKAEFKKSDASKASIANVGSSYAFQRMTSNLVVGKQKRNVELDQQYGFTPTGSVNIGGRSASKGDRLKVMSRDGTKVRVRDDRGNEEVIDAALIKAR